MSTDARGFFFVGGHRDGEWRVYLPQEVTQFKDVTTFEGAEVRRSAYVLTVVGERQFYRLESISPESAVARVKEWEGKRGGEVPSL